MIRQLHNNDYDRCMELVKKQPAENLFIISDIEAFGFDQPFQQLWGDFDEKGHLRAILLHYEGNFIPYGEGSFDAEGFADIFSKSSSAAILSGLESMTTSILPYVTKPMKPTRKLYYAKCTDLSADIQHIETGNVKKATLEDVERISELTQQIKEFERPASTEERKRSMEMGLSRTYYIEENLKMVSAASTTAENTYSAMVVGVCTLEDYQNQGLASQCLAQLCRDVMKEGKSLCLFYDNPAAGRIYKRLGFKDMDRWTMTVCK